MLAHEADALTLELREHGFGGAAAGVGLPLPASCPLSP
jgi:hypothetical protein